MKVFHAHLLETDYYKAFHQLENVISKQNGCKLYEFIWNAPDEMGEAVIITRDIYTARAIWLALDKPSFWFTEPSKAMSHLL